MAGNIISGVIAAIIGNYLTTTFVIGVIVALVQIARGRRGRDAASVTGILVNAYIFWTLGVGMILNFIFHSFFGDMAAKTIGWAQSPFQLELALTSLGFGVMAIILHGRRTSARTKFAVVLANLIFGWGAAGGHIYQTVVNHNTAVNNGGLLLWSDIITNLFGIVIVVWHLVLSRREANARVDAVPAHDAPVTASTPELVGTRGA